MEKKTEKLARALCLAYVKGFNRGAFSMIYDRTEKEEKISDKMYRKVVDWHYHKYLEDAELLLKEAL